MTPEPDPGGRRQFDWEGLIDQQADSVTIETNEGLMRRTNILTRLAPDSVVVEFDEEYKAGSRVTTNSHFTHHYVATGHGVTHRLTISDLTAPGLLGFLYRRFGAAKMGKAFLTAHQEHLEMSHS